MDKGLKYTDWMSTPYADKDMEGTRQIALGYRKKEREDVKNACKLFLEEIEKESDCCTNWIKIIFWEHFKAVYKDEIFFQEDSQNHANTKDCECDCHLFVGGSGKACPQCEKDNCGMNMVDAFKKEGFKENK